MVSDDTGTDEVAFHVNSNVRKTNPAPILTALRWSQDYDGAYGELLLLTQGVPATPPNLDFMERLAKECADPANTRYGTLSGEPELRTALARDICRSYCTSSVSNAHVAITAGCNMAAQVVLQAIAKAGDEVILPCPWYFNHEMCLDELGITLVPLPCQQQASQEGAIPDLDLTRQLISPKTRAIILVSPNNPTGTIYSAELLDQFFALCKANRIALILDETYRDFLAPTQMPPHRLFERPDWNGTLLSLHSFSKSYAIPGHRVGAVVASSAFLNRDVSKLLDVLLVCAPVPAQKTLAWAIDNERQQEWRAQRRDELLHRGQLFRQVINASNAIIAQERASSGTTASAWPGWQIDGLGAYYAYVRHPYLSDGLGQVDVARRLARDAGVVVLPAAFFGEGIEKVQDRQSISTSPTSAENQHLRFSIANILDDGVRALENRLVIFDRIIRTYI